MKFPILFGIACLVNWKLGQSYIMVWKVFFDPSEAGDDLFDDNYDDARDLDLYHSYYADNDDVAFDDDDISFQSLSAKYLRSSTQPESRSLFSSLEHDMSSHPASWMVLLLSLGAFVIVGAVVAHSRVVRIEQTDERPSRNRSDSD